MSTVLILTPVIIGSWPAITAAVAGAAAALGMAVTHSVKESVEQANAEVEQSVQVELAQSQILAQSIATGKEIVVTKDNVELRVSRDQRGRCVVCAKGLGYSKAELKQIAEEFTQKLTQCFTYNRVVSELKNKNFQIVNEEVTEDESVRINVRRWVD
jgi:ABC-type transporter MlaC component